MRRDWSTERPWRRAIDAYSARAAIAAKAASLSILCVLVVPGSANAATIVEYTAGSSTGTHGIVSASDGKLYFAEQLGDRVARISTAGTIEEFSARPGSRPEQLLEFQNRLWITESGWSRVARLNASNGSFAQYAVPSGRKPREMAIGPDDAIWFTATAAGSTATENALGRLDPETEEITEFTFTPSTRPGDGMALTSGPDGTLWFTVEGGRVGHVGVGGNVTTFGPVPGASGFNEALGFPENYLSSITFDADGNLWLTVGTSRIAKMTSAGVFTSYVVPTPNSEPRAITLGPDDALWFVESIGKVGRITTAGVITEWALPHPASESNMHDITAGPDGAMWFTDYHGRIGRLELGAPPIHMEMTFRTYPCPKGVGPAFCYLIRALADKTGTMSAEASLRVEGRSYRLSVAKRNTLARRPVVMRGQLPPRLSTLVQRSLERGRRTTLTVTLTARDRRGNSHMIRGTSVIRSSR